MSEIEEIEEDVEEILKDSKYTIAQSGFSSTIESKEDLEEAFEVIKRVYKKKPFDIFEWTITWEKDE